ncbi:MAG: endonuclease domain-containing protein, partial [Actinobacteria bacterium]|nr:endonuclease domain-containing protein [Actinomycetota bacterium]
SHESAGRIHEMGPLPATPPSLTVSHRSTHQFPGVVVHQSTDLLATHIDIIEGLRVTNPARTVIDLAQTMAPRRLERVVDNVLAAGIVGLEGLSELLASLSRKGKPGVTTLRRILEDRVDVSGPAPTELERRLIDLLLDAGLPPPHSEFKAPWLKPTNGRVDLAYPDEQVVIEADSRRWHALHDAFEIDRRRDNAAQLAGWIVLRFTWRMIIEEPTIVVDTVRRCLVTRRADGSREAMYPYGGRTT